MLKKDFLLFLHADWKINFEQLSAELRADGEGRGAKLVRIRKAADWMEHYAEILRRQYGVEP